MLDIEEVPKLSTIYFQIECPAVFESVLAIRLNFLYRPFNMPSLSELSNSTFQGSAK